MNNFNNIKFYRNLNMVNEMISFCENGIQDLIKDKELGDKDPYNYYNYNIFKYLYI